MRGVVEDSSTFLFPCTIEFSLICAAILFIMWKNVGVEHRHYNQVPPHHLITCSPDHLIFYHLTNKSPISW